MRIFRTIALTALLSLVAVAPAMATTTETAASGTVTATFTWNKTGDFQVTGLHLAISRAGATAYDANVAITDCDEPYCSPLRSISGTGSSIAVVDLDRDGEPEVLLDVFTGGAHCCSITQVFTFNGTTYVPTTQNWGDAGYTLKDRDKDGRADFNTDDDSFAYAFTSYAGSYRPLLVLDFDHGSWIDITDRFTASLKLESSRAFRIAVRQCKVVDGDNLGVWPAWAADQYRLGHRRAALRQLRAEGARGCIVGAGVTKRTAGRYVARVDRFLRANAYYR